MNVRKKSADGKSYHRAASAAPWGQVSHLGDQLVPETVCFHLQPWFASVSNARIACELALVLDQQTAILAFWPIDCRRDDAHCRPIPHWSGSEMRELAAKYVLLVALALAAPATLAQGAPDALLRSVADEIIYELGQTRESKTADAARVAAVVETKVLPLFDFVRMARLAVARNWNLATPEQQRVITDEFRTLLVRTYSTALGQYRGEPIVFKQLRATSPGTDATVRSEVTQAGKERMVVDYDMESTPQGWKIYGLKVAGVCLVTNYRDVFGEKVREGGVDGLIKFLVDRNRGGGSKFNSIKTAFWEKSRVMYAIFQSVFQGGLQ
ncbi:MAG: ABC transporter substrate-binding protein [Burkholderiales bacterium]|nr:ABC transporter substrate-binding protein [Burkholderiales bacterium]